MSRNPLMLAKTHDFALGGEPVLTAVMVHGLAADSSSFANLIEYIKEEQRPTQIRFVALDLLGSGKSRKDDSLNYDYTDQLEALHNTITSLNLSTPLVLVGHSMGTFIVTRYASIYGDVSALVLISPPIYTRGDLDNPAFGKALALFKNAVSVKNRHVLEERQFDNSVNNIILNRDNYRVISEIKTPTTLIYGMADRFIASHNIPALLKQNPEYLAALKTDGRHGVTKDKFSSIIKTLERIRDEAI